LKKIIPVLTTLLVWSVALPVVAESTFDATFNPTPLFNASNFMPGDSKEGEITISNTGTESKDAYIEAVNVSPDDDLSSQMVIKIYENGSQIYSASFQDFLNAGPIELEEIAGGSSKTFLLEVTFLENTGNDYQDKSLGFDICVGFSGGSQYCTDTKTISDERDTEGGYSGGDGSTSGSQHLIISNEQTEEITSSGLPGSGTALIVWKTNIPATSQVVYGEYGVSYSFDLDNEPKFGYPYTSVEDLSKKTSHSIVLTSLNPGQTYVYRVVSRASPPSVSYEHAFTVPSHGSINTSGGGGSISFSSIGHNYDNSDFGNDSTTTATTTKETPSNLSNMAGAFLSGIGNLHPLWWIFLILAILIIIFLLRRKNKNNQ